MSACHLGSTTLNTLRLSAVLCETKLEKNSNRVKSRLSWFKSVSMVDWASQIMWSQLRVKKKEQKRIIEIVNLLFLRGDEQIFFPVFSWCVLWTPWTSSTAWWRASSAAAALPPARTRLAGHLGWAFFQWPRNCVPAWAPHTSSCATVAFIGEWRPHHHLRHTQPVKSLDPPSLSRSL